MEETKRKHISDTAYGSSQSDRLKTEKPFHIGALFPKTFILLGRECSQIKVHDLNFKATD